MPVARFRTISPYTSLVCKRRSACVLFFHSRSVRGELLQIYREPRQLTDVSGSFRVRGFRSETITRGNAARMSVVPSVNGCPYAGHRSRLWPAFKPGRRRTRHTHTCPIVTRTQYIYICLKSGDRRRERPLSDPDRTAGKAS